MPAAVYRVIALALAVTFAAVGLVFFFEPGWVAASFAWLSRSTSSVPAGGVEGGLFRVLGAAYMYLVAWFAWMMARRPDEPAWPTALAQAKLASAACSVVLILVQGPSLMVATNAVVDGGLGALALWLRQQARRRRTAGLGAAS